jgi:putative ABC transport system substrate-binding protein
MITRRAILSGAAASLVVTGQVAAQQRPYRLAYLSSGSSFASSEPYRKALFGRLEALGYREGHNLVVDLRFGEGRLDRLPALAAELVALKPDVLFTAATQATLAASRATSTIPIVFVAVTDPVGLGIIKTLRQPGTNATGLSNQGDETQIKLLQLLKEVFPAASRVAVLHDPRNTSEVRMLPALRQAGATLGLTLRVFEVRSPENVVAAFDTMKTERPDVLFVMAGPFTFSQRGRIVELADRQRQAAVYLLREFTEAGGLMSYSWSLIEQHAAAAVHVDKILKGARAADLPVEQPTRFELVLNLRTAKAHAVSFPPAMLLRADHVIE